MYNYRGIHNAKDQYRDRFTYATPNKKYDFYNHQDQVDSPPR